MFFAAERQSRSSSRRVRNAIEEGIVLSPEMDISIGPPLRSRQPEKRLLHTVYPEFSSVSTRDVIRIADPDYSFPEPDERSEKRRKVSQPLLALSGDQDLQPIPESVKPTPKSRKEYNNLDELVKDFPELAKMIDEQQARLDRARVPAEYTVPYRKPVREDPKPVLASLPASAQDQGSNTMSTSSPPDLTTSAVPTPAEPALGTGGGLLSGMEAILSGKSEKPKLKSKYRR